MPAPRLDDPVLMRFRAALESVYGDQLERVVLFGSRARGDHQPDSDYDIAVFLKKPDRLWIELGRLVDAGTDILYDTGAVISAKPFQADEYNSRTALMADIRREGIDL